MRTLFNRDRRDLSLKGQITFGDGDSLPVEIGDIFRYSFSSQIGVDGLPLGGTEAASFSLELDNTGRKYTPERFDGAEAHMFLGIRPNPRNYILNSEFRWERRNWSDWGSPAVRAIVRQDGREWCHIRGGGTARGEGISQSAFDLGAVLRDGRQYTFSMLARGAAAQQRITVGFRWRSEEEQLDETWRTWTVGTTARVISGTVSAPAGADRFEIMVGVDDDEAVQDVYFTELMLEPGGEASEWMPAPEDFGMRMDDEGYAWCDFGVWYVDNASAPEQSVSIQLSGYDALATHFAAKFVDSPTIYPRTVGDLFLTVALAGGIESMDANFTNTNATIEQMPEWDENTTLRDVLSYCAICAGGFARITRDGRLEIASYSDGRTYDIGPDMYNTFTLTGGARYKFNAIEAMMSADSEEYTRYALYGSIEPNATNTIQVDYNPLLTGPIVNTVVTDLRDIQMDAGTLNWGGDPWVNCGDYYAVTTLNGASYRIMVTSQSFDFDGGLSASESCSLPSANSVSSSSYSTSTNAYDQNGNLRASRVAGLDGAVLAATEAHFKHLTVESAEFDSVLASFIRALNMVVGQLSADVIDTEQLQAEIAEITDAVIREAKIDVAQIENLSATILEAVSASLKTADIGYAQVKDLVADEAIITDGVGTTLLMERLYVTSANLLGATVGKLVLKGEDGNYYEVVISSDGTISTRQVTVTEGEIEAGETEDGRQIVATDANIRDLNAQSLRAQQAVIAEIFTTALTAGSITASEALLASATIPALYATTIKAIGDSLDLSANTSVNIVVENATKDLKDRLHEAELRITDDAIVSTVRESTPYQDDLSRVTQSAHEFVSEIFGQPVSDSKNLFFIKASENGRLYASGSVNSDAQYITSDYIPVSPKDELMLQFWSADPDTYDPNGGEVVGPDPEVVGPEPEVVGPDSDDGEVVEPVDPPEEVVVGDPDNDDPEIVEPIPEYRYYFGVNFYDVNKRVIQSEINYIEVDSVPVYHVEFPSAAPEGTAYVRCTSLYRPEIVTEENKTFWVQLVNYGPDTIWPVDPYERYEPASADLPTLFKSLIKQTGDSIYLQADKISWNSTYSSMTEDGILKCEGAHLNGAELAGSFYSSYTYDDDNNWLLIENGEIFGGENDEEFSTIDVSTTDVEGSRGIALQGDNFFLNPNDGYLYKGYTGTFYDRNGKGMSFINGILWG